MSGVVHVSTSPDGGSPTLDLEGTSIYLTEGDLDFGPGEGGAIVVFIYTTPGTHIRVRLNDALIAEGDPELPSFAVGENLE